ncbi:MAG: hypothetical protein GY873_30335 [Bosea sp.]|uniref:PcfJ domain-containing protein n=1 Tax=Bosea sp. (in: a-proteobacteria) TaxID=1871050 RepID=UPI0023A6E551|nr:hypothetical protein [Bosea sp. (in: a-proteobacteria)]MCP4738495.1 hypothetical protein [Bosea sp. (in: a-proteobacteria)]
MADLASLTMQDACSLMPFPTIGDAGWQRDAINRAIALFSEAERRDHRDLPGVAVIMARSHRFAIELIEQAPVLCLLLKSPRNDETVAKVRAALDDRTSLRDLLRQYEVAPQFRSLRPEALLYTHRCDLQHLSKAIDASTLSQVMPREGQAQGVWLSTLGQWIARMRRGAKPETLQLAWAAAQIGRGARAHEWNEIADLVVHLDDKFNPRWSWAKAREEAEVWHRQIRRIKDHRNFFRQYGLRYEDIIDYSPLPPHAAVLGLDFVALQSGEALSEDGFVMHHCVSSYAGQVIKGVSRIYSIRQGEKRLATLEVSQLDKSWRLIQLKGPYNSVPSGDVRGAARIFVEQSNKPGAGRGSPAGGAEAQTAMLADEVEL